MTALRVPVVVGLGRGVGTSTVAAALHAHEGTDRDTAADVVVCTDPEQAAAVTPVRSGRLPLLVVTGDGHAPAPGRLWAVESRFGAVVLLPRVERWAGLAQPADELTTLLGQPYDHLARPLQDYAGALRLLAAALVRSGQLMVPTPPSVLRPRPVELWRGLLPVERTVPVRPVLLPRPTVLPAAVLPAAVLRRPDDSWDDDTLEASGAVAGRAG